jgi:hypothetical protein
MDWTAKEMIFDSQQGQEIPIHSIQISSGAHSASYLVGTGDRVP